MRFSKPINREIDIDGNTFIVSFDDNGIDFRLKGKRRTAHVDWTQVFNMAQGEQGTKAREFLGVGSGQSQQQDGEADRTEQIFEPQMSGEARPHTMAAQAQAGESRQPQEDEAASTRSEDLGRAVSAGDVGPES